MSVQKYEIHCTRKVFFQKKTLLHNLFIPPTPLYTIVSLKYLSTLYKIHTFAMY